MAAVNKKEDQYIRLKMLVGLSTKVLRKKFDKLNPPDELQKKLDTFKSSITHRIHRKEYDKLYPPGGAPVTSDDMDLTALVRVLRNTDLVEPLSGFGCNPPDYDTSFGADVVRILLSRNKVNHVDFGNLQEQECKNMSQTLIELENKISAFSVQTVMAAVSKSEDRFIRLNKLVDLGTVALRKKFDILIPPGKLKKTLDTFKSSITHKLSRQEKNRLYPPLGDPVTSDDLDLMSMVRVLRNTVLDEPLSGFGCHPKDRDISFAADVKRIQISRNTLDHTDYRKLEKHKCENMSHTLIEVIKRLDEPGVVDQIKRVMTGSLDYRAREPPNANPDLRWCIWLMLFCFVLYIIVKML